MKPESHPQLKKALVNEAILEIRYEVLPTTLTYGVLPGSMYEALKNQFPNPEELPTAQVPIGLIQEPFVRHRFLSKDKTRMFQLGVGILSINQVSYTGYGAFKADCRLVLEIANRLGLLQNVQRLGLRYINLAQLDRSWDKITTIRFTAPGNTVASANVQEHKWQSAFDDVGILATTVAWPVKIVSDTKERSSQLTIDLDHFKTPQTSMNIDAIMEWLDNAHENVYTVFKSLITNEYFAQLSGEVIT